MMAKKVFWISLSAIVIGGLIVAGVKSSQSGDGLFSDMFGNLSNNESSGSSGGGSAFIGTAPDISVVEASSPVVSDNTRLSSVLSDSNIGKRFDIFSRVGSANKDRFVMQGDFRSVGGKIAISDRTAQQSISLEEATKRDLSSGVSGKYNVLRDNYVSNVFTSKKTASRNLRNNYISGNYPVK